MKSLLAMLLIGVLFSSCATSRTGHEFDLDDADLAWLENTDFIPAPEVPYRSENDFFSSQVADADSLSSESIARLPDSHLQRVARESNDPISRALSFCYQNRFDEAFRIIDESYDEYKSHPSYWNQLGTCYFLLGEINKSLLYYNKARGIDEGYAPAINNIGVIYQRQGFEQKALSAFEEAAELNTFSRTPSFNLAQLYLKHGFAGKSRNLLAGLHQNHQGDRDVLNGIATSYLLDGEAERAVVYYNRIPRSEHSRPYIGLNFSVALKMIGRDRDAETVFSQVNRNELNHLRDYYFDVESFVRGHL